MADQVAAIEAEGISYRPIPSSKMFYVIAQHERSHVAGVSAKEVVDLAIHPKVPWAGNGTWPKARVVVIDGEVAYVVTQAWSVSSPLAVSVYADFLAALQEWTERMREATRGGTELGPG